MSFRKRGEVINGANSGVRAVPGRTPVARPTIPTGRTPTVIGGRNPVVHSPNTLADRLDRVSIRNEGKKTDERESLDANHPGVKPSPATSHQTTSTGSFHLDKVLGHSGLPLGNSLLVEEQGTTDFGSILCKLFSSQGIVHNRIENSVTSGNTHLIVLSINQGFAKELPGVYKGSRKDIRKSKIAEEEAKVTVQNLTGKTNAARSNDLKIAWRYGLGNESSDKEGLGKPNLNDENKNYSHQFDITTRLMPAPSASEITFISPLQPVQVVLNQVEQAIKKQSGKIIRIVVPSLLHPAMYPPSMFNLAKIMPLLHGARSIVKNYGSRCILFASVSSDLLDELLLTQIENTFDSVINLEPFDQEMTQLLERAYKSQPNKIQHGLLHIIKLPIFSERGEMHVLKSSYAFKNGKRKFEIEEWGIPVDDIEDTEKDTPTHEHAGVEHKTDNTKVSVEF